ncbi:MAG: Thioredoxin [uncultured Sulfurovum sp.]|uniref:Thioredoxin n=1 Tax=uncultured Sulfurovum sp. TaxID=269237 RepID=A0A6S6SKN9_9BACT|nr:MAG: Thioredoxin [uncultured Sulfurovum sp.]
MPHLIFVIDPMCSWCWGFHPIINTLREKHSHTYTFSLIIGGLRTKGQMPWTEQSKQYLAQNWNAIQKKTKQPFNFSLLNKNTFDYDTYPACKALISIRELWGENASFEYLATIQKAFYTKGEDITSLEGLLKYVKDKKRFVDFYQSDRAEILMQHDFAKAHSMGANAFPSIVKIDEQGHMCCIQGYKSLEEILTF